jgi:hypothetical protein
MAALQINASMESGKPLSLWGRAIGSLITMILA